MIPHRSMRIPDDLWFRAKARAEDRRETVTAAVVRYLEWYVGDRKKP